MNINITTMPTKWAIIIDGELVHVVEGTRPLEMFTKAGQVVAEHLYWHSISTDCVTLTMNGILQ